MNYLGDFAEDATVYIPFNTFDSNDPAASVTITNLADADIMVHKDGGLTQIATDGATIAIDFDGITGNHLITIDTSVHADYSTGSDYMVRIEGTTVDGGTINAWVGCFSIENRFTNVTKIAGTTQTANDNGADINAILVDTDELQTNQGNWATATGFSTHSAADVLTTQMTESYAANGAAPTLAQAQFAIHQMLMQFGISGTSLTVRKLDDSTTAFVVTLDDATSPTDAKRV